VSALLSRSVRASFDTLDSNEAGGRRRFSFLSSSFPFFAITLSLHANARKSNRSPPIYIL
jgi:hypothetical protein